MGGGGAGYWFGSWGTVSGNTIEHNQAAFGGGLYFENATDYVATPGVTVTVTGNTIKNNSACCYYQDKYAGMPYCTGDEEATWAPGGGGYGGGVCLTSWSRVELIDNDIVDNTADFAGGGVSSYDDSLLIFRSNRINRNSVPNDATNPRGQNCGRGGGLFIGGNVTFEDNSVCNNSAREFGGASFWGNVANVTITHNTFSENSSAVHTGGVGFYGVNGTISQNTFADNTLAISAGSRGGNVYITGSTVTLTNNLIQGGEAETGGGLYVGVPDGSQPINVPLNSNVTLTNNTIACNQGGGVLAEWSTSRTFSPVAGKWDGNGHEASLALFEPTCWFLEDRSVFSFGKGYSLPLAGDWAWPDRDGEGETYHAVNADGRDAVGVYYPADFRDADGDLIAAGTFELVEGEYGRGEVFSLTLQVDAGVSFASCLPIAGDWDGVPAGSGQVHTDRVGLYDPAYRKLYRDGTTPILFNGAGINWIPLAGDWDGDGRDTLGFYDPAGATFYLADEAGHLGTGFIVMSPTPAGAKPFVGDWDGAGPQPTTVGLFDPATGRSYYFHSNAQGSMRSTVDYVVSALYNNIITYNTGYQVSGRIATPAENKNAIDIDPQFVDPDAGNFRLTDYSSCKNGGADDKAPSTDIDGNPKSGIRDIGCYEYTAACATVALYDASSSSFSLCYSNTAASDDITFGSGWIPIAGDWNGDNRVTIGLYDQATSHFYLWDTIADSIPDTTPDYDFVFGTPGAGLLPIAGNWKDRTASSNDSVGVYDSSTGVFFLRIPGSVYAYETYLTYKSNRLTGGIPIAGDWDGDANGIDTIGLYLPPSDASPAAHPFYLTDSNSQQAARPITAFQGVKPSSFSPVVGDWDGGSTHKDSIGLYSSSTSQFYLRDSADAGVPAIERSFTFGTPGTVCLPIAGDWDCDSSHSDTIGLYDPSTSCCSLRNSNQPGDIDGDLYPVPPRATPIVGDWDGSGLDTTGLYKGKAGGADISIRHSNTSGAAQTWIGLSGAGGWKPIAGDWDGDGFDTIGLYDPTATSPASNFMLRASNTTADEATSIAFYPQGWQSSWKPIAGDWDGDGDDDIGLYDPTNSYFHLRYPDGDHVCPFGQPNSDWIPLAGDWDGDGRDTVGLYNPGTDPLSTTWRFWFLLCNSPGGYTTDALFRYGEAKADLVAIAGDWMGNGYDSVGLYDPTASVFTLRSFNNTLPGCTFAFGDASQGPKPVAGDWDGTASGVSYAESVGVYYPNSRHFALRSNTGSPIEFDFGTAGVGTECLPIAGDWAWQGVAADGVDTVGLYDPATSTFYLHNYNTGTGATTSFAYGSAALDALPVSGDWNGDGIDTVGLYIRSPGDFQYYFLLTDSNPGYADYYVYMGGGPNWMPIAGDWNGDGIDTVGLYDPVNSVVRLRNSNDPDVAPPDVVLDVTREILAVASASIVAGMWGNPSQANHAPTLDSSGDMTLTSIDEDTPNGSNPGALVRDIVASAGGNRIADEDRHALEGIAVTNVVNTSGTWQYKLGADGTWADFGAPTEAAARLLSLDDHTWIRFLPNANWYGTVTNGITFRAWDRTCGAIGELADATQYGEAKAFSTDTETIAITVLPVNDSPVLSGIETAAVDYREGDSPTRITYTTIANDPDNSNLTGLTVQITEGYWYGEDVLSYVPIGGGITGTWNAATGTMTLSGNAGRSVYRLALRYVNYENTSQNPHTTSRTVTLIANDGQASNNYSDKVTRQITVTAVNDAPTLTAISNLTGGYEDTDCPISYAALAAAADEADVDNANISFRVETVSTGTLTKGGVPVTPGTTTLGPGETLVWRGASNANGVQDAFVVKAWDGQLASAAAVQVKVDLIAVNDAPQGTAATVTTNEDVSYVFGAGNFAFTDSNDNPANTLAGVKITTLPTAGTLRNNGTVVTAGQTITVADIAAGRLVFTPVANANGTAYATFTFQVQDSGGTTIGGVDLDPTARLMTINVNSVNDAPQGTAATVTTNEDVSYVFGASNFTLTDPNDAPANTLAGVKITTFPTAGTLRNNGTVVTAGQTITVADIAAGRLVFTPVANANGTPYASFTFQVQDSGGTTNGGVDLDPTARTMTINVTAVNDPPMFMKGPNLVINEDAGPQIVEGWATTTEISAGPADEAEQELHFIVTSRDPGLFEEGSLAIDILTGTLTFTPAANANTSVNGPVQIEVRLQDDGDGQNLSAMQVFSVTINSVNDLPTISNISDKMTVQGVATGPISFTVGDVETPAGSVLVTATSSNTTLVPNGNIVRSGSGADRAVTITPAAGQIGTTTITVTVTDSDGGSSSDTFVLRVSPTLDVDGNGTADALTDGILIIRYLFNPTGNWSYTDAIGTGATRTTRSEIRSYLDVGWTTTVDVDGNGGADALTDGILILRYLFAPSGNWTYADAVGVGATRTTRTAIREYLDQFNPVLIAGSQSLNLNGLNSLNMMSAMGDGLLSEPAQIVSPSAETVVVQQGEPGTFEVNFTTSDLNPETMGLGLYLFYDSTKVSGIDLSDVIRGTVIEPSYSLDSADLDNDPTTDWCVFVGWASLSRSWPGDFEQDPETLEWLAKLYTVDFYPAAGATGSTTVNFACSSHDSAYHFSATPVTITINAPPTLAGLASSASSVVKGNSFTLTASGATDTDGEVASVAFYRESNGTAGLQTGEGGDELLGTDSDSEGGWSVDVSTAGWDLGAYTYYALATDNHGGLSDAVSAANSIVQPDLVALVADARQEHVLAGLTTMSFTLKNQGQAAAGAFDVEFVLSDDAIIGNADDVVVARITISPLAAGASIEGTVNLNLPVPVLYAWALRDDASGMGTGYLSTSSDYLGLVIDPDNVVAESAETNNLNQGLATDKDDITYFPWDLDGDGSVTSADVDAVSAWLYQAAPASDPRVDLDGDGQVTSVDRQAVLDRLSYCRNDAVISNAAPQLDTTGSTGLPAIDEDQTSNLGMLVSDLIASAGGDPLTDVDAGAVEGIAVTAATTAGGTWQYSLDGGTSWTAFGAPSNATARLLAADDNTRVRFVPDANWNGTVTDGLTFRAWDRTLGFNGGTANTLSGGGLSAFSTGVEVASITVNAVNDLPGIGALDDAGAVYFQIGESMVLTVSEVADVDGSVVRVGFYRESNGVPGLQVGEDTLVGYDEDASDGWGLTVNTGSLSPGNSTYYVQATDDQGGVSADMTTAVSATHWLVYDLQAPITEAGGPYTLHEGQTSVVLNGNGTITLAGTITTYEWDLDGDGVYGEEANHWVEGTWHEAWTETVWVGGHYGDVWVGGHYGDIWHEAWTETVLVPGHNEQVWVEAHYGDVWHDAWTETILVPGQMTPVWVDGHNGNVWHAPWTESVFVAGHTGTVWIAGYYSDVWHEAWTENVFVAGHYGDVWVAGYYNPVQHDAGWDNADPPQWHDEPWTESVWVEGHNENQWIPDHNETIEHPGYWEYNVWTPGYYNEQWIPDHYEDVQHEGYWQNEWIEGHYEDQWVPEHNETVQHEGYWQYNVWIEGHYENQWVQDQYQTIEHPAYSEWGWIEGHYETGWIEGHDETVEHPGHWDPEPHWEGGGARGDERGAIVTFDATGLTAGTQFNVGLRVTNDLGRSATDTATITILPQNNPPTVTTLTGTPSPIAIGQTLTLTATGVSDTDGSVTSVGFYRESNGIAGLQIGDNGDTFVSVDNDPTNGWTADISTTGMTAGDYTYYVLATDDDYLAGAAVSTSVTLGDPLRLAGPAGVLPSSQPAVLTDDVLQSFVQLAMALWESAGLTDAEIATLQQVTFQVGDLSGDLLGLSLGGTIVIDMDAVGYGWFLETDVKPTGNHADLLTVVLHELGHELGFADILDPTAIGLMSSTLPLNVRRLPDQTLAASAADRLFAAMTEANGKYGSNTEDGEDLFPT
jgi:hypothetical protein